MPSRNIFNLLTLAGGVSGGGAATGVNPSQLSINGARTLNSEFTVDGVRWCPGPLGACSAFHPPRPSGSSRC